MAEMATCSNCKKPLLASQYTTIPSECYHCDAALTGTLRASLVEEWQQKHSGYKELDLTATLRIAGWLEFAGSLILTLIIWTNAERIRAIDILLCITFIGAGVFILAVLYALAAILQELRASGRTPRTPHS